MGDIADMMIEGVLCERCGEYIGEDCGFSRLCDGCAKEAKASGEKIRGTGMGGYQIVARGVTNTPKKAKCHLCGRKVKEVGLPNHMKDAHPMEHKKE